MEIHRCGGVVHILEAMPRAGVGARCQPRKALAQGLPAPRVTSGSPLAIWRGIMRAAFFASTHACVVLRALVVAAVACRCFAAERNSGTHAEARV
jgi:hypothetical protein